MTQPKRGRRQPFRCGHRGLGRWCHRCEQAHELRATAEGKRPYRGTAPLATVRVLPTESAWFGVTYPDDKPHVVESIAKLVAAGDYPSPLG